MNKNAVAIEQAAVIPYAARIAGLALGYFLAAKVSLAFAIPPGYATAVWLPSGISVAAIILWGMRCWPGLWLGSALANYSINLALPAALGMATGNTLEALCAGGLAAELVSRGGFRHPQSVFLFAAIAAGASGLAASAGAAALYLSGAIPADAFTANWYTWWQGDTTGILVVAPCVLAWAAGASRPHDPVRRREIIAFAALFGAALLAVFARAPADLATLAIAFLTFPFFAWAACRYSERAITSSVLAAAALAVGCTANGLGPFAAGSLNESLLALQAFTSTAALVALALGTFTREGNLALRKLRISNDALDKVVRGQDAALDAREQEVDRLQALAHVGFWTWDARSDRVTWSDELCRIYGLAPGSFEGSFEHYLAHVDERDRTRIRALLHGALFERRPWEAIERILRADGAQLTLHSFCFCPSRRGGQPARLRGFCVDVSERVRLEQVQAAQHEIGLLLAHGPQDEGAVSSVLRILCEKMDWATAHYWTGDADAGLRLVATHGGDRALPAGSALAARAWREQHALYEPSTGLEGAARCSTFAFPVGAAGEAVGVITLHDGPRAEAEAELLEMGGAAGALVGEHLIRRRTEERLRALSRGLLDAQDFERRQVARELRESIARPLAAAHADLGLAQLEAPLQAARELIAQLRPASLDDYGLHAALRAYAVRFARRTGIAVDVAGGEAAIDLEPRLETTLFQIARDALENVARHSCARHARVELEVGAAVLLSIRDDGDGFDSHAALPPGRRRLTQMRERAEAAGGRLHVESSPGGGTRVSVRLRR
ncbi:MAG: sensor histidine kinase [Burkholderiales bacterium]